MGKKLSVLAFNNKTWIINIQYMLISCIILAVVILIDTRTIYFENYIPQLLLTKVPLATTILSALAGALLSMTVFTFSTIMTIVSFYSSNYTASTIDDFVKTDIILKVLGIFIGGFFYSVTALLFMRESYEHEYVIAGSVGVMYALVCVGFFIRFVQHILYTVQSTNLIKDIYEEAFTLIQEEVSARENFQRTTPGEACEQISVQANQTGYISSIYYEELAKKLAESNTIIEIHAKMGDFTVKGAAVATLYVEDKQADEVEVTDLFVIQDAKIPTVDYQHRKSQLIDILLKALPPGKADLNTAIHCLRKLSVLMAELAKADGDYIELGEDAENIIYKVASFEEALYFTYYQIVPAAEQEISVVIALFEGLYTMSRTATALNQQHIKAYADNLMQRVVGHFDDSLDQQHLEQVYGKF